MPNRIDEAPPTLDPRTTVSARVNIGAVLIAATSGSAAVPAAVPAAANLARGSLFDSRLPQVGVGLLAAVVTVALVFLVAEISRRRRVAARRRRIHAYSEEYMQAALVPSLAAKPSAERTSQRDGAAPGASMPAPPGAPAPAADMASRAGAARSAGATRSAPSVVLSPAAAATMSPLRDLSNDQTAALRQLLRDIVTEAAAQSANAAKEDQRRYFVYGLVASVPVGVVTGLLTNLVHVPVG